MPALSLADTLLKIWDGVGRQRQRFSCFPLGEIFLPWFLFSSSVISMFVSASAFEFHAISKQTWTHSHFVRCSTLSFVFYRFSCFVRCCHFAIFLISHPSPLALRFTFADDRSNFPAHHLFCEPSFVRSFLAPHSFTDHDWVLRSGFFLRLPIFILWVYFVCQFTSFS